MSEEIVLYATGDVLPNRPEPGTIFDHVRNTLQSGDIVFCQFETNLSQRGILGPPSWGGAIVTYPNTARAVKEAGFNVVSFASNHCLDWGVDAFLDTVDELHKAGLQVIGVGKNIEEARRPAIVERKGTSVAFLGYNSILPQGYWAEENRPGCAPLRVHTLYEQIEYQQPGTPCRIRTFPRREDLDALLDDIRKAKAHADLLVLSMHWGIHFAPAVLADYQREVGRLAIDDGADLIIGTHAHILKPIEVYKGKVMFHSLCNFALELSPSKVEGKGHSDVLALNPTWTYDPEYPTYYMPPDSRKTIVAKCIIADKGIKRVTFLPTYVNKQTQPEILSPDDPRFNDVVAYMQEITRSQGIDTEYVVEGSEVAIK